MPAPQRVSSFTRSALLRNLASDRQRPIMSVKWFALTAAKLACLAFHHRVQGGEEPSLPEQSISKSLPRQRSTREWRWGRCSSGWGKSLRPQGQSSWPESQMSRLTWPSMNS